MARGSGAPFSCKVYTLKTKPCGRVLKFLVAEIWAAVTRSLKTCGARTGNIVTQHTGICRGVVHTTPMFLIVERFCRHCQISGKKNILLYTQNNSLQNWDIWKLDLGVEQSGKWFGKNSATSKYGATYYQMK